MSSNSIIRNREVLHENYIPEQMWFRKEHLKVVAESVKPLLSNLRPRNVLIHGPSGAGKTSSAKFFLYYLNKNDAQVRTAYIDCWKNWTRFTLLKEIALQLGLKIISGKNSTSELLFRIEKMVEKNPCVLVLDELDQLQDKWLLYFLRGFGIATIMISTNERILVQLNQRLRSRIEPCERALFPAYNPSELASIIELRVELALNPNTVTKSQIRRIALSSAGNAHLALEALRLSCSIAESKDSSKILDEHLDESIYEALKGTRKKNLSRFNSHQLLLYKIVKQYDEIPAGLLHKTYTELSTEPMSERVIRNYLHKLAFYGFIRMKGSTRGRVYSCNY